MNVREAPSTRADAINEPSAAGRHALMSFDGIWRHWGRGRNRWAVLRGVDLQIPAGAAVRVEGGNGAGKTTLLRIGAGILRPDAGFVHLEGVAAEGNWREYHQRVGFLSSGDRGLYARFSVRGHLVHAARIAFMPRAERKQAVEEALVRFDLQDLAKRRADRLSQGQRQRLRLALTVVHRPRILLLDEPRNSLDGSGQAMLAGAVADVLSAGGAVLWCSPAGEEQPVQFDRSYVIRDATLEPA
jgi:ABC-type multidrug transport system ATPase subunit